MGSYHLVVSGVNPRRGDQSESAMVCGPARGWARATTAQPHQNQGKTVVYENHSTSSYQTRTRALTLDLHSSRSGVALGRRKDTSELVYGLGLHRARCGEAVVNR